MENREYENSKITNKEETKMFTRFPILLPQFRKREQVKRVYPVSETCFNNIYLDSYGFIIVSKAVAVGLKRRFNGDKYRVSCYRRRMGCYSSRVGFYSLCVCCYRRSVCYHVLYTCFSGVICAVAVVL